MPTMGLKTFSLSSDEKLSFFAGESVILSVSIADAAYLRVSMNAYSGKYSSKGAWRTCLEGVIWRADIVCDKDENVTEYYVYRRTCCQECVS